MSDSVDHPKDEIDLIEIFRVLWKWKFIILVGTLVFALLAGVLSIMQPKMYRINMVLQPGVVSVDRFGRKRTLDSAANMKAIIQAGTFNSEIRKHLKTLKIRSKPGPLNFRVTTPKGSAIVKISYETPFIDTGITILDLIPDLLQKEYADTIKHFDYEIEQKIKAQAEALLDLLNEKGVAISNINNFEKRLKELKLEVQTIEHNNNLLLEERRITLNNKRQNDPNVDLSYNNAFQQNMRTLNEYKNQSFELLSQKEETDLQLKRIEEKIKSVTRDLDELEKEKNTMKYIQVLQTPTSSRRPVKPRPKVAAMLGFVLGFFIMIIGTFFIEHILQHLRKKEH